MSLPKATVTHLEAGIDAACQSLLNRQHAEGFWWGQLASNVCMESEYVLLCHCLNRRDARQEQKIETYLFTQQNGDGTWSIYPGGPPDLNATVEAYVALKLIGVSPQDERMVKARTFVISQGGIEQTRVFTRLWLALVGEYPWAGLPEIPPEIMYLPKWMPLNIYDFASWARATIVALTIVMNRRPVYPLPDAARIPELRTGSTERSRGEGVFAALDRALKAYRRFPVHPLRRQAEERALDWILKHQEADGNWGGIQPPWFYSLIALHVLGQDRHPAFEKGWQALGSFAVEDGETWWFQACVSPVWDTGLSVLALRAAGVAPDHPALVQAGEWLCNKQIFSGGDWQVRRPHAKPGGWAFEFYNDNYPDVDDTAIVVQALNSLRLPNEAARRKAMTAGFRWLVAMQSKNGGWGAFDADNTRTLVGRIPFCDFGEVIDPPSEDVTAHVLECFGSFGYDEAWDVIQRALAYLRGQQTSFGPWLGRWGVNYIYGTGAVIPALAAVGVDVRQPWVQQALHWLAEHQNEDGGWGEDCRSYDDERLAGIGVSTPSQTGWALLALIAGGWVKEECVRRGVDYLLRTQRPDGRWDEQAYTGTGFPRDFYIGYEMYRDVFPLMALGRYRQALSRLEA
ncbi:MAG: squalene--hopene cyclase [Alicyclobacillus herbarius]|uniref:squalene--hopene cyclase n=1 Tax=Alicyclobacillus herbarius TaxID=122960 RepID=UPI002355021F|nr:squalene--hopene cyclase [Alicyclobacillus herbarius]MCL6631216.1 squalene--hopene cyclase [Alicyclobacillus herbarius]